MKAIAHEIETISDTAKGINADEVGDGAHMAYITCQGANIRYWLDGADPTSDEGHKLETGDEKWLTCVEQIEGFRAIRAAGTDATLMITYGT